MIQCSEEPFDLVLIIDDILTVGIENIEKVDVL
jgi:hypothetical protein